MRPNLESPGASDAHASAPRRMSLHHEDGSSAPSPGDDVQLDVHDDFVRLPSALHDEKTQIHKSGGLAALHSIPSFVSQAYPVPYRPSSRSKQYGTFGLPNSLSLNTSWSASRRLRQWGLALSFSLISFLLLGLFVFDGIIPFMKYTFDTVRGVLALILWNTAVGSAAVPPSFPASGKVLWYRTPATAWWKDYLPIGNGYLGATVPGGTLYDETVLNIGDLWSGGPFQNSSFNGGNPVAAEANTLATDMKSIRQNIFNSTSGTIPSSEFDVITTPIENYGSFASPGRLVATLGGSVTSGDVTGYTRWLDLDIAVVRSQWTLGNTNFNRDTFCSNPSRACVQITNSSTPKALHITYALGQTPYSPAPKVSCLDGTTMLLRGSASDPGMDFEVLARVQTVPNKLAKCTSSGPANATISVDGATTAWVTWVGGTNFDQDAGDEAHSFSFRGVDPHKQLVKLLDAATSGSNTYASQLADHVKDVTAGLSTGNSFQLSLGQKVNLQNSTDEILASYSVDSGDPYLEWLLFEYGRYMLFSSSRGGLPANLQGIWARDSANPWGADYHSNINIQMNYWSAEATNLDVTGPLWNYMEKNWAPRGAVTARILYNITRGWVTHNEMDIFGYTGMKGVGGTAQWANYPESAVWFMIHAWDHFDYTNDVSWWKTQGWPLLKGVASFHLDKLLVDERFNDGTLVVSPCNSPEQPPITFGCAHAQQIIWQMFNAVEKGYAASGDNDIEFLREVQSKRDKMDKGLHIGSWGQLQEWKVDMDDPTDTHRHLSHLVGLYPGYAVSNYAGQTSYSKSQILDAAKVSLIHRGNGTGPDADAGWEKIWRASCWAQLGDAQEFYHELTYVTKTNFGPNLFSLFGVGGPEPIFQIDANLGYPGAVVNALVQALDVPSLKSTLTINLLPALPSNWNTGSVKGFRVRGGLSVSLWWENGWIKSGYIVADRSAPARPVEVVYQGKQITSFTVKGGTTINLSF